MGFPGLIGGCYRESKDSGGVGETSGVISDLSIETPDITSHERIPSKLTVDKQDILAYIVVRAAVIE